MKRTVIESRTKDVPRYVREKIEAAPIPCVVASFIIGIFVANYHAIIIPLLLLAVAGLVIIWFIGETDDMMDSAHPPGGKMNGPPEVDVEIKVD